MVGAFFVALHLLYSLFRLVVGHPVCGEIFGRPSYSDCEELATDLDTGWPGDEPRPDRRMHFFSVLDAEILSWVSPHPRYQRIYLPKFAQQG